jgi:hypothetical protein
MEEEALGRRLAFHRSGTLPECQAERVSAVGSVSGRPELRPRHVRRGLEVRRTRDVLPSREDELVIESLAAGGRSRD